MLLGTPDGFRPIVQVIDNLERNEKMGLVFEAKVGAGSLLVVGCDLSALTDAPEAKQLLASLLRYAGSSDFTPIHALSVQVLDQFLRPSLAAGRTVTTSSSFTPPWGFVPTPASAVDGDINTRWQAAEDDLAPQLAVDLGRISSVDTVELLWEHDQPGYGYLVETSVDGSTWTVLSDQRENTFGGGRHLISANAAGVRHLRVSLAGWPEGRRAALRDLRVLGAEGEAEARIPSVL